METWPITTLTPQKGGRPVYMPRNTGGGQSALSGFTQVVAADAGLWMVTYENIVIRRPAQILEWDRMELALEGRLNPLLVPIWEGSRQPNVTGATVHANAALGATSLRIDGLPSAGTMKAGHFFGISNRLYQVRAVTAEGSTWATVDFRPPLRAAATAGDAVKLKNDPVCKMRLTADNGMDRGAMDLNRFGSPSVSFIEDPF
jgi:hypothetical protein